MVQPAGEQTDPRIVRSRRMLMDAMGKLLVRKAFDDISVQDIADEAALNRATFYLHYADKNALLQAMSAARFQELVDRRGLSFSDCDSALRAIALGVCDYLADTAPLPLERSIIPVLEGVFRAGSANHPVRDGVDPELMFSTVAWAIYGAARRWMQSADRMPAEEMAAQIEAMVRPILLSAAKS